MQPEEAVIGSKQILNHPNMINNHTYFAWSDHQQMMFQETVVLQVVMPWTKVRYRSLQVFYHSYKFY